MKPLIIAGFLLLLHFCLVWAIDDSIRPFQIKVDNSVLKDLKERLSRTRFPEQLFEEDHNDNSWKHGANVKYMKEFVEYWQNKYDWKQHEDFINSNFPQYITTIDGIDIHFIHVKSNYTSKSPMLMIHGWPGSITEFCKIIPMLTDPVRFGGKSNESFDLVIPSIPGYGFSGKPQQANVDPTKVGELFNKLMLRLGYKSYISQGGDWGSLITLTMARQFPDTIAGIHVNMAPFIPTSKGPIAIAKMAMQLLFPSWFLNEGEYDGFIKTLKNYFMEGSGYFLIQATKPQTVGFAQSDSPAGLAAYIIEKFYEWSGHSLDSFTKDELITNIMFYWVTNSQTSSMRLYYEMFHNPEQLMKPKYIEIPTGVAIFPNDIILPANNWIGYFANAISITRMPAGGHFAALETPELLAADIRQFVGLLKNYIADNNAPHKIEL